MSIDGRQRSFTAPTKAEALARARQARADAERGMALAPSDVTLQAYATSWLAERRPALRVATWTAYQGHVDNWIVPRLGRLRLADIAPGHVRRLLNDVLAAGRSENTAGHVRATLSAILRAAMHDVGLQRNVAALVPVPSTGRPPYQPEVVTPADARAILDSFQGSRLEPLVMFAVATGLRRGELLALAWSDVDLAAGVLHVRHSLDMGQVARTKTLRSARTLTLPRMALDALALQRRQSAADQLAAGPAWRDNGLVFPGPLGGLRDADAVTRNFGQHLRRRGLPAIRLHALRRIFAAQLQAQGVPIHLIRDLLGHSQLSVTQAYAYTMPDDLAGAMSAVDRAWAATNKGETRADGAGDGQQTA